MVHQNCIYCHINFYLYYHITNWLLAGQYFLFLVWRLNIWWWINCTKTWLDVGVAHKRKICTSRPCDVAGAAERSAVGVCCWTMARAGVQRMGSRAGAKRHNKTPYKLVGWPAQIARVASFFQLVYFFFSLSIL